MKPSSKRQLQILNIISSFTRANGFVPSYREIAKVLGLSSASTVHKHVQNLKANGLLNSEEATSQAIKQANTPISSISLPIIGSISRNRKIEISATMSFLEVPEIMAPRGVTCYGFIAQDNSFLQEQIVEGDLLIIEARISPREGEMILLSSQETGAIIRPYSIEDTPTQIQGIYIGLLRSKGIKK